MAHVPSPSSALGPGTHRLPGPLARAVARVALRQRRIGRDLAALGAGILWHAGAVLLGLILAAAWAHLLGLHSPLPMDDWIRL